MVNVLDTHPEDSVTGLFMTDEAIEAARKRSARQGVLDGQDTARVFNWMRPNDLIWNYVVSNYLHGETPPAFDILYWNNDTTRLPARLHSDFLDIFKDNPFRRAGMLRGPRRADRSEAGPLSGVHHRWHDGPHHALAGVLSLDAVVRRARNLRAEHGGPHSEPDQSARRHRSAATT